MKLIVVIKILCMFVITNIYSHVSCSFMMKSTISNMKKIKKARRSSKQYFNSINGLNSFQNNDQMHYNYNRLGSENVITCTNPKTNIYDCDKLCLCRFMAAKIEIEPVKPDGT